MTLEAGPKLTTLRIYLNGELKQTAEINGAVPIRYDRPMPATIGSLGEGGYLWIGSLDNVRIYNRTLSSAGIQKLFTAGGSAQNLSFGASPAVPPAVPAMMPPPPPLLGLHRPGHGSCRGGR